MNKRKTSQNLKLQPVECDSPFYVPFSSCAFWINDTNLVLVIYLTGDWGTNETVISYVIGVGDFRATYFELFRISYLFFRWVADPVWKERLFHHIQKIFSISFHLPTESEEWLESLMNQLSFWAPKVHEYIKTYKKILEDNWRAQEGISS